MGQVTVHHLETVVETPQGTREDVTDTLETTTGRGVCLEHDEGLAPLLGKCRGVEIRRNKVLARSVAQILREELERILGRVVRVREDDRTVVARVAGECMSVSVADGSAVTTYCSTARACR